MNNGEKARVAYVKSLPAGTELRIGNVTVGEAGGALHLKGVPIDVLRDSPEYTQVLNKLADAKVGKATGFADQALVADAFFASTEGGAPARFLTSDTDVVNKLSRLAGIEPGKVGGFPGLLKRYGATGFPVTIKGRTILVVPAPKGDMQCTTTLLQSSDAPAVARSAPQLHTPTCRHTFVMVVLMDQS
jgi:hypothetical protein